MLNITPIESNHRKLYRRLPLLLMVLFGLHLGGCSENPEIDIPPVDGETVPVGIELDIPINSYPVSRAMDSNDEHTIGTMDILVFLVEGGVETYAYRAHNTSVPTISGNRATFMTHLKRSEAGETYRLVLLANLRDEVDELLETVQEGDLKENVISALEFSQNGPWPSKKNEVRYIPMWGETNGVAAVERSTTLDAFGGTVKMLRSLAKIDIVLDIESGDDNPRFEINRIKVYNTLSTHAAAPGAGSGYSNGKVTDPTLVSTVLQDPHVEYVLIGDARVLGPQGEIYIGEAANAAAAPEDNVFLLVEGFYTKPGEMKNTDKPTWYRIDFRNPDHTDEHLDILRNHLYRITINHVGGPGDEDEEEAVRRGPFDMVTDITVWSDGVITDVVWNGQYYLGVSQTLFELSREPQETSLTVTTNYPDGWEPVVDEDYEDWLSVVSYDFTGIDRHDELVFEVDENTTGGERTGYVNIVAGNLTLPLKVIQSVEATISIEILDSQSNPVETIWFDAESPTTQKITVNWKPTSYECFGAVGSVEYMGDMVDLSAGENPAGAVMTGGTEDFNLLPQPFTPDLFEERTSRLYFTTGGSTPVTETVIAKQLKYELIANVHEDYDLDGKVHTFQIMTNADWTAEVHDDPNNVIVNHMPAGGRSITPRHFDFEVIEDAANTGSTVTFRFYLSGELGQNVAHEDVTIIIGDESGGSEKERSVGLANCYIVKPEGYTIKIPVQQANEDGTTRITDNMELLAKFIWTDQQGGLSENGCVAKIMVDGKGPTADLVVTSGNTDGNAVVAVTNTSGTILWSWHIWVTEFDPDNDANDRYKYRLYEFLDRNLGALEEATESHSSSRALGLYYQWGRKDPFPYPDGIQSNNFIPIYNETGTRINFTTEEVVWNTVSNLENSIQNPLKFFISWNACWYSGISTEYYKVSDFWNVGSDLGGSKGVYDPCPEGWRTVPGSLNQANADWYKIFTAVRNIQSIRVNMVQGKDAQGNDVDLGVWPATGTISTRGNLQNVGSNSFYWTGNRDDTSAESTSGVSFQFDGSSNAHPGIGTARGQGQAIRCIRRDPDQ